MVLSKYPIVHTQFHKFEDVRQLMMGALPLEYTRNKDEPLDWFNLRGLSCILMELHYRRDIRGFPLDRNAVATPLCCNIVSIVFLFLQVTYIERCFASKGMLEVAVDVPSIGVSEQ